MANACLSHAHNCVDNGGVLRSRNVHRVYCAEYQPTLPAGESHDRAGHPRFANLNNRSAFAVAAWMLPLIYLLTRKRFGQTASIFAAVS